MFKFRSFVSMVLVVSMIGYAGSAFASPVVPRSSSPDSYKVWTNNEDVIISGEKIGTKEIQTSYEKQITEDGSTIVNLKTDTHYDLSHKATDDQENALRDRQESTVFEITSDGEYYVNGVKLDEVELNKDVSTSDAISADSIAGISSVVSGGVPSVGHYYGNFDNVHFASYDDLNILGGPQGSNHQADGSYNSSVSQRAMSQIDIFYSDHYNLASYRELFKIQAGLAVVTIVGVISAIAEGAAAAYSASQVWGYFQNCKNDLTQATNAIDAL